MSDIEHHVAMDVTGLVSSVVQIECRARNNETAHLIARDFGILSDAHAQLGRTLARLAQKEAAE